ncbi:Hsp70 family protein [Aureisphaera galaxeae]|uniref:Hsp70 family protein n=1 Tax=Aureisphaera galaxeae TaxID=1538023 RepID=UPI002350D02E|nr:Hsp70 family protein [Aureisphaera galaxeae]MDC8003100.1 Hsp70 family protein [Aureisphaera galaxeae]
MEIEMPKSPYVLGIDLGTTNSSAAIYSKGESQSLKLDEIGRFTIPSCVWFPDKKTTDTKVGLEAKQKILINPDEVFSSFKPLMKNNEWKKEEAYKNLAEKFEQIEGVDLTPTDIAVQVLKAIKDAVLNQMDFDLDGDIQEAVICVPANTTDQYRKNVYEAALKAGFGIKNNEGETLMDGDKPEGVHILEEPTAAAFAYGLDMGFLEEDADKEQTILVYDLGGGTFDSTILHLNSTSSDNTAPKFTVKATRGVAQLGGDDFDRVIMEMVAEEFKEEHGLDIFDLKSDQNATLPRQFMVAQQKLKEGSEMAKIELANGSKESEIIIPEFLKDGDGNKYSLEHTIKKDDFVERIKPLLDKANECVVNTLKDAELGMEDINRVILVGGSTKADWIKETVETLGKTPFAAKNVDVIVSRGAAFYGASVPSGNDPSEIEIDRTTNHHLGIEIEGAEFSLLVEKDLPISEGITKTKTYYNQEQQETVNITIYKTQHIDVTGDKGERTLARKHYINEKVDDSRIFDCIGDFRLTGIPKAAKGQEPIEVTFSIDQDDTLAVTAKIVNTGATANVEIKL